MIKGLYTATSGMVVQERKMENISNNLANAQTPSYKSEEIIASAAAQKTILSKNNLTGTQKNLGGMIPSGVQIDEVYRSLQQGLIVETGRDMDFAISGDGYFQVPSGYSRNGSLTVDPLGALVNSQGQRIQGVDLSSGASGDIFLEEGNFNINKNGLIEDNSGKDLYKINLVEFENPQGLEPTGDGTYTLGSAGAQIPSSNSTLVKGSLEQSNVNILDEMVKMIEVQRLFESNQRVVQAYDETLGKAVNDVGRL